MRFEVRTSSREEFIDITHEIVERVSECDIENGAVLIFVEHTTAGVTINENADPDVCRDLASGLRKLAPRDGGWKHREGNSDGHLKSSLVGPSVVVPLSRGRLVLGRWQGIYLCEFDGPRARTIDITVLPGVR